MLKRHLGAKAVLLLVAFVGGWEGLRLSAYKDIAGIPTICYGHIEGVRMGDRATPEQCSELLLKELEVAHSYVEKCITHPLSQNNRIALTSATYNLGPAVVCGRNSSVRRYFNSGNTADGCRSLALYNKARDPVTGQLKFSRGLDNRRKEEVALCLKPD